MELNNKDELKIGMVIDDYKLPDKEIWWAKSFKKLKNQQGFDINDYDFVREEAKPGIDWNTTSLFRYYKLKESK